MSGLTKIRAYYHLTKPGIIRGNLLSLLVGFFLASGTNIDWWVLLLTMIGVSCVIGGGCVFNNYIDRGIDKKMSRTSKRSLVTGEIPASAALVYASILSIGGLIILLLGTNLLTMILGLVGLFFYVVVYGYAKRTSVHGTLVGSISGAIPPVAGYTAVTGQLDVAAGLLFLILTCWQMPHFYAISIYRKKDYKAAKIPVLSVVKGNHATKIQIIAYIVAFIIAASLLTICGYAGLVYLLGILALGTYWLVYAVKGLQAADDDKWAKGVFGISLLVLLGWSALVILDIICYTFL